ncbi:hypothetical protein WI42_15695 [Burkholderia ubonensis]|nr:hypothetical protein WI43_19950 [Burkholderia ubonensis]KVA19148.1 hypothetical protein WI42_15695 [Burkholderia ubonensis]KVA40168.1 hypothetical protein WI46_14280 [Burkholderia ubonensis]
MRLDAPDRVLTLTFEMHRDSSCFGDPRNAFDRVLMLTCRIHSLSSCVGADIHIRAGDAVDRGLIPHR